MTSKKISISLEKDKYQLLEKSVYLDHSDVPVCDWS
jgi:hypothetical protein